MHNLFEDIFFKTMAEVTTCENNNLACEKQNLPQCGAKDIK